MSTVISTTARATDVSHLELHQPLRVLPEDDVRVLIFLEPVRAKSGPGSVADFLAWANRPRPRVGLAEVGRGVIYED
jgi:hypothetical protein